MIETIFADFRTAIFAGIILAATFILAFITRYIIDRYIDNAIKKKQIDPTSYKFLKRIIIAVIYIVGIALALIQIPEMKTVGHSMLAGAGVLTLVMGLASQQVLGNIMSGLIIVLFKPFKLQDRITINGNQTGIVEDINLRQVIIRDVENNRIIVPNSIISNNIIVNNNMNETKVCKQIIIGIGYDSDIDLAMSIMQEEVKNHPLNIDNRSEEDKQNGTPEVITRVIELADSSVNIKVWMWANNTGDGFVMYCDLLKNIKERFDKEGIEIPYNYQNVIIQKSDIE